MPPCFHFVRNVLPLIPRACPMRTACRTLIDKSACFQTCSAFGFKRIGVNIGISHVFGDTAASTVQHGASVFRSVCAYPKNLTGKAVVKVPCKRSAADRNTMYRLTVRHRHAEFTTHRGIVVTMIAVYIVGSLSIGAGYDFQLTHTATAES